ncbi:transmembrane protein 192 [Hetaerina americana]|uniref:transmembrane protein 192 n=1 Tax=Hetaerina americana TaxID=62018 RepID=UPI003A7F28E0
MVSIARGVSVSSGGGVFLSSDTPEEGDDNDCILSSRDREDFDSFSPLNTGHIVLLQLMIAVGVELTAVLLYFLWPPSLGRCEPFYIIIYTHAVFWLIALIIHNFLRLKHHVLRLRGYVDFHKVIATSGKITFYIVSATNTLMLVIVTILYQNYGDLQKKCDSASFLKPYEYLLGIITIENMFFIPYCLSYIAKVRNYNKERPSPDFMKNDWGPQTIGESSRASGEIGLWNANEQCQKLLEKQAGIIRCLRDRNDALCALIIQWEASFRLP